ncbi:MAG TPA: hypothetical protein VGQ92_26690 [Actinoplanes sp.]|nr:hypothetical protein [Actinoplanes sp.]
MRAAVADNLRTRIIPRQRFAGEPAAATPAMITLLAVPLGNAGFFLFLAVAFGWIAALAARLRRV